ncbi:AhpC/TSA family protein [Mucilaginibacter sp. BJC16-A38]|uniref:peroxiredoxin-like family protein n=1 Tax=Mucilaginibacter phenanthrenivorans TaxID=1234842 RepID=UPI002157F92F|nr:peroxiredoxin-like family protein [Mucilaginibacter phenanthrenivorans]MCR8559209.1 AhpC/TSA family protein [Mucilaginibacter phenanthrenivorans]
MKIYILIAASLLFSLQIMAQTGLKTGVQAPEFTAKDNSGKVLDLKALLKQHKSVVLFFYRGQWCPYCNKHIQQLQDSLQLLTSKDAYVIGVTPETGDNINKTVEKTHASFSIVQDAGYKIMKAYDVKYTVDANLYSKLKGYGVDLEKNNGNTDHVLPVPATYVINSSGKIVFVQFDKDYTKRASISSIAAVL